MPAPGELSFNRADSGPRPRFASSRILRDGDVIWEKPFLSGEGNMSHSFANLEHHHFKYDLFRRPGDVHVHFFGTATLSFTRTPIAQMDDPCAAR